ncbi:FAD-binding oxidoreductase [Empedobacter tilapiae]|uniref:Flavoprotein pyridine nucleotide cytochrome reductase-like FAD-binding domain-containing protein n=1 Tax=Empedobacter tilapiae TaxID=2491114 RepID=A0A4Z1BQ21_9FLAO|nr:FAD-binding oxidoreductase [Empedobacter tilapiae]TGN24245.1 hypothetical protein E4J94_13425 [Empedobacter tilapiae]
MIDQSSISNIYCGTVIHHAQIAKHIYHIKIQSMNLSKLKYVAGLTTEIYLSNPFSNTKTLLRKFSVWNFEPVFNTIDFAINTYYNGESATWIKSVQLGDKVFFKEPKGELLLDDTATEYLLIGNITSLSYFYELNRAISISKNVYSLIFTNNTNQIFPDIDHSFPLNSYLLDSKSPDDIIKLLELHLPKLEDKAVVYVVGDSKEISLINKFLKNFFNHSILKIHSKSFWDNDEVG